MNANQPEKLVPPADRDRAPSAGDMANPDELKDDLENTNTGKRWRNHSSRRNGAKPSGAGQRIRLIWRGRSGPIPRVIYMKNLEARRSQIREFANERCSRIKGWEILDGVYRQVLTRYKLIINK